MADAVKSKGALKADPSRVLSVDWGRAKLVAEQGKDISM